MATKKATTAKKSTKTKNQKVAETDLVIEEEKEETPTKDSKKGFKPTKRFWTVLVGILILGGLVFLFARYFVVAWVDKQPVTRFELYQKLDQRYGKDMTEQIVVEKLILNEAKMRGINVGNDQVQAEIAKIEQQQGGAEQFNQILEMQGISRSELNQIIRIQLLRDQMFGQNINITDQEVDQFISDNKDQFPQVDDALKTEVKDQLKQQKINSEFNNWLQSALQSSRVVKVN